MTNRLFADLFQCDSLKLEVSINRTTRVWVSNDSDSNLYQVTSVIWSWRLSRNINAIMSRNCKKNCKMLGFTTFAFKEQTKKACSGDRFKWGVVQLAFKSVGHVTYNLTMKTWWLRLGHKFLTSKSKSLLVKLCERNKKLFLGQLGARIWPDIEVHCRNKSAFKIRSCYCVEWAIRVYAI